MMPTHALLIVDNHQGRYSQGWIFAYIKDGIYYCYGVDVPVIENEGDQILKVVRL